MENNTKLVSIIIPAYNAEQFIDSTIRSVISQTYTHWELIVIDDGSMDDTKIIVEKLINFNNQIKYISQKNSGVSSARNNGIKHANGVYLAFLDADDLWRSTNLEEKVKHLNAHQNVGLVHAPMEIVNQNSQSQGEILSSKSGFILNDLLLWKTNLPSPSSILVRRSVVDTIGNFDENLSTAADQDFYFRVSSKFEIGMIEKVLGCYRVHLNNMSKNIDLFEKDHIKVYRKASALGLFKNFIFKSKCFSNMYLIMSGSWYVNANNKSRALYFGCLSILVYPPNLFKFVKKLLK